MNKFNLVNFLICFLFELYYLKYSSIAFAKVFAILF